MTLVKHQCVKTVVQFVQNINHHLKSKKYLSDISLLMISSQNCMQIKNAYEVSHVQQRLTKSKNFCLLFNMQQLKIDIDSSHVNEKHTKQLTKYDAQIY